MLTYQSYSALNQCILQALLCREAATGLRSSHNSQHMCTADIHAYATKSEQPFDGCIAERCRCSLDFHFCIEGRLICLCSSAGSRLAAGWDGDVRGAGVAAVRLEAEAAGAPRVLGLATGGVGGGCAGLIGTRIGADNRGQLARMSQQMASGCGPAPGRTRGIFISLMKTFLRIRTVFHFHRT